MSIKIINYALDESPLRGGSVVLRGIVHPSSINELRLGPYQREDLRARNGMPIYQALVKGEPYPDIELGMRGERMSERDGGLFLQDPTFIIDGQQRISTTKRFLTLNPNGVVHIGCLVHLNTDEVWETERFNTLNTTRTSVNANVLLRNERTKSPCLDFLYQLSTEDTRFVLYQRVSWSQRMQRNELIPGRLLAKVFGRLHGHLGISNLQGSVANMASVLDNLFNEVGAQNARMNLRHFFEAVDEIWGITNIQYKDMAAQLRNGFLFALARMFSEHEDFWPSSDKKLLINADIKRKLRTFAVNDPNIRALSSASSAGPSNKILLALMIDHVNSGRRTGKLTPRMKSVTQE